CPTDRAQRSVCRGHRRNGGGRAAWTFAYRIDCRPEFLNSDTSSCLGRIEIRPTTRSRAADTRSRHKVEICSVQAASDWNATGHASAPSLAVDGTVRFPSYRQPSTVNALNQASPPGHRPRICTTSSATVLVLRSMAFTLMRMNSSVWLVSW